METEWHTLGKVQYQKWTVYDMDWKEEITDLRDYVVVAAPYGGPMALLRDPKRLVKVDGGRSLARTLMIFNACGKSLAQVSWTKYDEKDATTGRLNPLIHMSWTDELRLLCVFENGTCITFSITGELETRFAILPPTSSDKVVSCEAWGGGFVALTEKMALIQTLDVDSVRPKVSLMPDCGLSDANPPTCMAVIEPRFLKSIYPEVLLGTTDKSLVIVGKENGAVDMKLRDSLQAPVSAIAVAPNGMFMALFTQDGILTVMNTMLDKKILTFDTQSKSSPRSMCWCGEDSVLLYWPNAGLIMVGPYGSWLRFPYDESLVLAQEMDCCRVYRASAHDIVLRVPSCIENIKGVGSTAPAAMLFQAMDSFDAGDAKADEHIRYIQSQHALEDAIKDCVDAAGHEFEYASQTAFLRAASYGKCFVDSSLDGSGNDDDPVGASSSTTELDTELFVEMCRKIRVLNALRQQNVGFPLTLSQFDRLSPEVVISRLVAMRHHFLALKICEYLKVPTDRVLVHWACEKVKSSPNVSDEELVALVRKKLKQATLVSYADIATCAERVNRRRLATMFLDLEENATDQVPLLLSMGEFELALRKSLDSNNTDLIFMTLFHLERTLPSMDEFRYVLNRDPVLYAEATNLMLAYYKASKSTKLSALWNDVASAENDLLLSIKAQDVEEKVSALKEAMTKYNNAKLPMTAKLAEEQMELVQEQKKLEEKPENIKKRTLVGLSVSDTMKILIQDSKYEPKLLPLVAAFSKKFKVPEKRFYRVKIQALAETQQWDALHKFSQEKKTPPCGFKAFAVACLAQGEKQQAESYTARITAVDEKFETLIHLEMYQDALQLAIKLKDPEKLTSVRNMSGDQEICNQADRAAVELGFVS
ncbi:hypothetical protein Poli38472_010997 [Pythium oligandrum]|uniref:Vacuolar protein sorting-associated protein 16 homolog n=1 Tax=Pythium oligandrum TaxID=41045 RepID=A0A8K1FIC5_PYTOL|nr:hypothetical protein Poli38472_010997 [Pythium oligandrum]|eukprot:TMW61934.1 hypothetical protein Poli38472_010997 [Pythium oligandrum]